MPSLAEGVVGACLRWLAVSTVQHLQLKGIQVGTHTPHLCARQYLGVSSRFERRVFRDIAIANHHSISPNDNRILQTILLKT